MDGMTPEQKAALTAFSRLGGLARAKSLTKKRRKEIAAMGAAKREANKKAAKRG